MAIDKKVWDKARMLFEYNKSLNDIKIATGIDRSTISKKAKEKGWKRNPNKSTLIQQQVDTTIKQIDINQQKSTLIQHPLEEAFFNQEVMDGVDLARSRIEFDTDATNNQALVRLAQQQMNEYVQADIIECETKGKKSYAAMEIMQTALMASKVSESNRKQIHGTTQAVEPEDPDAGKTKGRKYIISFEDDEDE